MSFEIKIAQGTDVGGPITIDTTWDLAGSPYFVIGDVTVGIGVTLTIEPGVQIKFDGFYSIYVDGTLRAIGTETNRIIISSNKTTPVPGNWRNIRINSNGHAEIRCCNISYAIEGIYLDSSYNNITNNFISQHMSEGIYLISSSNNHIVGNDISNNGNGIILFSSLKNTLTHNNLSQNNRGIELTGSSNNIIADNNVSLNNNYGIVIRANSDKNTIANNTVSSNGYIGISISSSNNITITNNIISDSTYGIQSLDSSNHTLVNNTMLEDGIYITGADLDFWNTHSIDTLNTVNGKPVFYWKNQNGGTIPPDAGQVILANCTNVKIENQNISSGSVGIQVGFSINNYIANSTASNNRYGIHLYFSEHNDLINNIAFSNEVNGFYFYHSSNNTLTSNNISYNNAGIYLTHSCNYNTIINNDFFLNAISSGIGIHLSSGNNIRNNNVLNNGRGINLQLGTLNNIVNNNAINNVYGIWLHQVSNKNNITNNHVSNNGIGIHLTGSSNNNVYHNNIIDNSNQGYDDSNNGNQWDNGYPSGGNYWSDFDESGEGAYDDYKGPNQDDPTSGDGIVDNGTIAGGGKNPYVIDSDSQDNYPLINPADISPPIITNLQPPDGSTTNDNTPIISANYNDPSGINLSSVLLVVDGIDVTSSAIVTSMMVMYIPATALPDGVHTVYIEVKDNADNLATATWTFTVDSTPPTISNLLPPDASVTTNSTPVIGADYSDPSGIDVSSVVLKVDGINVTPSATVTTSGVSYIPAIALPEGVHTVYLEVRDIYGNLATATWSFTVDTIPPTITNLQPPDTSTTNDSTPTIGADYSDPSGIDLSSVLLKVDGIDTTPSAIVTASGVSYIPPVVLPDGVHTVYIEVKDNADNIAIVTWTFTVEATPPIITNLQPPDASTTNDNTTTISADYSDSSDINVSSVLLEVDGMDVTSFATITASGVSYIRVTALPEGVHTVYLEVKDIYGNLATATWNFTVDTLAPIITNLQPPDASTTNDSNPIISADYSDPSGINVSSVLLEVDGINVTSFATITASNITYIPGIALLDNVHTVYLEVKDIYGNLATATWSFTVDTLPPMITNLQPPDTSTTNDSAPTISADYSDPSGIDLSSVVLKVDGIDVIPSAAVTASGVSFIPGTVLPDAVHTVYLEVKDNAGNLATAMWSFTVEATPPIITNLQPPDASTTNDSNPIISADYSDLSGINISSVLLEVDGLDMTSSAMVNATNVTYLPGTALSDGIHTVYLEVRDDVNNLATATWSFTVDTTPPITTISPDDYTVKLGTLFTLTATDGVGGCGVNYTQFRIDNGQWIDFSAPFSIDTYERHNITYRSVDNLGNIENEKTLSIYVPKAPITTLIIGSPQYGTTPRYVNQFTQFSFSVIDYSGTGYDTYYNIDTSPPILYIGPFTVSTEGTHTIYYYSNDNLGNIEDTKEFDIIVDNTPPQTDIATGEANYVSGDTWVTSATGFTLNAIDGGMIPVGVNHTKYRIWNGGVWTSWNSYASGFSLGTNEGVSYLEYYSIDWLGNEEPFQNRTFIIDNTPPTTTISVGDPKYKSDLSNIWNVTSATTFVLFGVDDGAGLNYTEYRIWDNGSWSDWNRYTDGFRLGADNSTRYVEWFSVDYLGNKGGTRNETYFVDNIPPETNYLLLLESDNTEARLSLIPSDVGSGVDFTKYRIDSGDWIDYSDTFVINESGEHEIYFWSADRLGNIEDMNEVSVLVEEPGTPTPSDEEKKETNNKPLTALIFSIILLIVGSYVSYKRPLGIKWEVSRNRLLTWLFIVLPFVIAEIITGVISLFTGMLSVPPILGVGMIVDMAILVIGLVADGYIYKKGRKTYTRVEQFINKEVEVKEG